jgi:hypothetical protein
LSIKGDAFPAEIARHGIATGQIDRFELPGFLRNTAASGRSAARPIRGLQRAA